jgi:Flp pilus assembly protein TadD
LNVRETLCYLRDTGDYAGAENQFEKAFSFFSEVVQDWIKKGYYSANSKHGSWKMKEDYAILLRSMGRHDEAERAESESQELKIQDDERKLRRNK